MGGGDARKQIKQCQPANVIVATPGRLLDFVKQKKIHLEKFVVAYIG